MGGKSSPPPAPDPYKTADAQSTYNKDTAAYNAALNRYNVSTPLGSQTWTQNGTDPTTGAPIWSQSINLTPTAQSTLDQNQKNSLNLAQTQGGLLGNVASQYTKPMSTEGMPGIQSSVNSPNLDTSKITGGQIQSGLAYAGPTADRVRAGGIPIADQGYAKQVSDALYGQSTQYLDPQFSQGKESFDAQMANQGLVPGSEAYQNALTNFNNEKQRAYSDARNQAITGGVNAMQSLYGMGLQGQGQQFNQGLSNAQLQNSSQQQRFNQGLLSGQFGNEAQQQAFSQGLASQQAQNQALGQQYQQNYNNATLNNNASNQYLQQQMALYNQPLNTYNSLMTGSQVSMPTFQGTPSVMAEAPNYQGAVNQNYQGQLNAYNAGVGSSNSMMGGLFSLGGSLLGAPAGSFGANLLGSMAAFSDRRLKSNIVRVGTHPLGVGLYEYDIFGKRQRGVMADEVEKVKPDAVSVHPSGFKVVNYGAL